MLHPHWKTILYPDYMWLVDRDDDPLDDVVDEILACVDDDPTDPITEVHQSSVWAVAMLYKHFRQGGGVLSSNDFQYAMNRGGVLGITLHHATPVSVTLKEYLSARDNGFRHYVMGGGHGVRGA